MSDPNDTLVKICGITRAEDALVALEAGADWLGFIRWPASKRFRPIDEVAALIVDLRRRVPRPFQAVGVYVDEDAMSIVNEVELAGFDRVQLHGDEPPELAAGIPVPVIKCIRIKDASSVALAENYPGVDLLTDTHDPATPGGTGKRYDPGLLENLVKRRKVIVAGGLAPDNVAEVVQYLRPYGVDVSSGVESEPGIKDPEKIQKFISAAKTP